VRPTELEFEIQLARDGDNPGLEKYHVHIRCFTAWVFERDRARRVDEDRGGRQQMMRALLVVLCLLLSIVPASTEGAWVLWNMSTEKPRTAYVDGAKLTAQQQRAAERDFIPAERGPSSQAGRPERPWSRELHLSA